MVWFDHLTAPEGEVYNHPLDKEIHISRNKKDRIPLGLLTDKSLMENIPIANGKLTVYNVTYPED